MRKSNWNQNADNLREQALFYPSLILILLVIGVFDQTIAQASTIAGKVWHDVDTDVTIASTGEPGTNAQSATLTVYAVNPLGKVVSKSAVASDGLYSISGITSINSVGLKLRLSNNSTPNIGEDAPTTPSIPSGWFYTGESSNGMIDPVISTLGEIVPSTITGNLINQNFGIRQSYTITAAPAPTICTPDFRTTINTGIAADGTKLAVGSKDLNWTSEWIVGPPGGYNNVPYATPRPVGIMPAIVSGKLAGTWISELPNALWISYPFKLTSNSTGNHQDANLNGTKNEANDTVRIKYTATLTLPTNALNISVSVPVGVSVDNQFVSAKVNNIENIPLPLATLNPQIQSFTSLRQLSLNQGWTPGINTIEIITDSGPPLTGFFLSVNATTAQICGKANVQLLKRITGIRTANGTYGTTNPNNTSINLNDSDTNTNFPVNYIKGKINGGVVKSGDEIEYTIYYVNKGGNRAKVKICDLLSPNLVFNPDGFNTGQGIQLQIGTNSPLLLTSENNPTIDRGYYLNGIPPNTLSGCNLPADTTQASGTVVVDLNSATTTNAPTSFPTIPGVQLYTIPNDSYGLIKFRAKAK